ncbi:MAG: SafA/ExsA family spore coat assembly protein [Clostridia bacterium]|nr:SafA/ExsA family spore coat assembly protein [Clostridia bacterium]
MKKIVISAAAAMMALSIGASAATHTVQKGDTMWKIAVKYEAGLSEIRDANPQVTNANLIYPGQVLNIPTVDAEVLEFENEIVRLVNEIRKENGLNTLTHDWELSRVARYKSQDMKDKKYFAHNSPTYGTPYQMMTSFGITYRSAGENLSQGYSSPKVVVNAWMNSAGHRKNILNPSYTKIGVGYVKSGNYCTQMFTGK